MKHAGRLVLIATLFFSVNSHGAENEARATNVQSAVSIDATVDAVSKRLHPPVYPRQAIAACARGEVVMIVDVDADGRFVQALVERSSRNRYLDRAGLEAARHWTYHPARDEKGERVADKIRIPLAFEEHEDCWSKIVPDTPAHAEASSVDADSPRWPEIVEANRLSGAVGLLVLLESDGSEHEVRVEKSSGDLYIDLAAKEAAARWSYAPALLDGKPVRSVLCLSIPYGKAPR